jgi:hypothetical protein
MWIWIRREMGMGDIGMSSGAVKDRSAVVVDSMHLLSHTGKFTMRVSTRRTIRVSIRHAAPQGSVG